MITNAFPDTNGVSTPLALLPVAACGLGNVAGCCGLGRGSAGTGVFVLTGSTVAGVVVICSVTFGAITGVDGAS